jgi:NADPH-dependent curcumin reductase CurA
MAFHRAGVYAVNMGLDSDNVFRIGGWSAPANLLQMNMSGSLTMLGEVTAYSDARLKDNVQVIADPLTKVLSIRGVNYTRTDLEDKDKVYMGVIAQEVEQYIPEVVTTLEDGTKTVNYGAMAGLFIESIKAQQAQIDELKAMILELTKK